MERTPEKAVATLLREAEATHGAYESNVLGGVYDEAWPAWYAAYLVEHGLGDHLSRHGRIELDELSALLARLAADYERGDKAIPWPDAYARRIVAEFPRGS